VFLRNVSMMSNLLGSHALRIAVKDASTNQQVVEALAEAIAAR